MNSAAELINRENKLKTGVLNLSQCDLTQIPDEIFEMTWLKELYFGMYSHLGIFRRPYVYNKIYNISTRIAELKDLEVLSLAGSFIGEINSDSLDAIASIKSLEVLHFGNTKLANVNFILQMPKLKTLSFKLQPHLDCSPIIENINVRCLLIESNDESNDEIELEWLKEAKHIESLVLHEFEIRNVQFLDQLNELKSIELYYCEISDLSYINELVQLESLKIKSRNYKHHSFHYIDLSKLTELKSLSLYNIQDFPIETIKNLKKLEYLSLVRCNIFSIEVIRNFSELKLIDLTSNSIEDLEPICNLKHLEKLLLSNNRIENIPLNNSLPSLTYLNVSRNPIVSISFLKQTQNIKILHFTSQEVKDVSYLEKLSKLECLIILRAINFDTSVVSKLKSIKRLTIQNGNITGLSFLSNLTNIEQLDIRSNDVTDITPIQSLTKIKRLDLSANPILAENLKYLKNLKLLNNLSVNIMNLDSLSTLCDIKNLTHLYAINNEITDTKPLINHKKLVYLDLSHNHISDLNGFPNLQYIKKISLRGNSISNLTPLKYYFEKNLKVNIKNLMYGINVGQNPLTNPPYELVERGHDSVKIWFSKLSLGSQPLFESKLMILGEGESGKTTFSNLLLNPTYKVKKNAIESTLGIVINRGIEFPHNQIDEQTIHAHLWDFGGQNIQKMLHQFFITNNCLYVIVSDKRAENTRFDYWFQIINLLGPKSNVIVVQNQKTISSFNNDFALKKYQELFPLLTISTLELNFSQIAKKDKSKWNILLEEISNKLSNVEIVNRPVPSLWTLIRDHVNLRRKDKYITKQDFYNICQDVDLNINKEESDLCLFYLKELGELVYFDDRELSDYIFLDHDWLTKGLYFILSNEKVAKNKGQFTKEYAFNHWGKKGYNESEKLMLLNLLLKNKFDICYELEDQKNTFITPLLLPSDKPYPWIEKTNLYFRYNYGFIPHGMLSRLLVRISSKIDSNIMWESGARLTHKWCEETILSEIQQIIDPSTNQSVIDLKLSGSKEGCKELLDFIRIEIDSIHNDFKNIGFKELVACNCKVCKNLINNGKKPHFYDFNDLKERIKYNKYFVDCGIKPYSTVNIGEILSDVVIENMAERMTDIEFFEQLKENGLSINMIKNENNPVFNNSPAQSVSVSSSSSSEAISHSESNNEISIEINNILDTTDDIKEDIETERSLLLKEMDETELNIAVKEIENAEKYLGELSTSSTNNEELPRKPKKKIEKFMSELQDKESFINKTLRGLRKGKEYAIKLGEGYNKIAENTGMPLVPPILLETLTDL
ncbi:leucine-rich repeat domain-containing protein [Pseudocolwellia agarivorans]|uniref:leucine-rich repeat domain-containing protein n=1 Tax=Pseudocolwellia agarivorans TaxID=1911682 RepID=UPI003F8844B9